MVRWSGFTESRANSLVRERRFPASLETRWMKSVSLGEWAVRWAIAVYKIAPGWSIFPDLRPRSKLRLTALYGPKMRMPPSWQPLAIRVTNVGKQPVVVTGIAVRCCGGSVEYSLASRNLPKRLEPNQSIEEPFDLGSGLLTDAEALYAYDSSGQEWRLPQHRLKELRHQAKAVGSPTDSAHLRQHSKGK